MDAVDKLVGERIVGTKIAAKPGAEVVYAPLPAGRVFNSPARVPRALTPSQYMECEISFRLTRDLPARQDGIFGARGVRRAGGLRRVRAGGQPLPRSEIRDGQHALRILRRPHRQRRHGVRRFRKDWQKFDFSKTRVSMKQGGKDHHRKDRRPSDRQSGQARGGAGQPAARHDGTARPARSSSPARSPAFIRSSSTSR